MLPPCDDDAAPPPAPLHKVGLDAKTLAALYCTAHDDEAAATLAAARPANGGGGGGSRSSMATRVPGGVDVALDLDEIIILTADVAAEIARSHHDAAIAAGVRDIANPWMPARAALALDGRFAARSPLRAACCARPRRRTAVTPCVVLREGVSFFSLLLLCSHRFSRTRRNMFGQSPEETFVVEC